MIFLIKPYYSFINSEGKVLTDFIYERIEKFENGQAWAYHGDDADLIDLNGNIIKNKSDNRRNTYSENWRDWGDYGTYIDDAFEGDSSAYWNID